MKRKSAYRFSVYFFVGFLVLALFAWAGSDVSANLARLEKILSILEKHPERLWRLRPNLDTIFEGTKVRTDPEGFRTIPGRRKGRGASCRIITFGASPTFGYAVRAEESYPKVAETILRSADPDIDVKNAGQIGYSSWQGLKLFMKTIQKDPPDIATVSYMVNDIDRLRFFFSNGKDDVNTRPPSRIGAYLYNALARFGPTDWFLRRQRRILVRLFGNRASRQTYELSHVRVGPEAYRDNLYRFVKESRKAGFRLIFLKMPFRLPETIPPAIPGVEQSLSRIREAVQRRDFAGARHMIEALLKQEPYSSLGLYYLGLVMEAENERAAAQNAFSDAARHLIYDCARDARSYNEIMEKVSRDTRVPLVDAASALGADSADMELFVTGDYIHPNPAGHRIVGRCLARAVQRVKAGESEWFVQRCD